MLLYGFVNELHAQWVQIIAPSANNVEGFATRGADIVVSTHSTIYRSGDYGLTWFRADSGLGLADGSIYSFAFRNTTLYSGTGNGVCRSTDIGSSWTCSKINPNSVLVNVMCVSGSSVFAGSIGRGIFRSTDDGATWSAVNAGLTAQVDKTILSMTVSGTDILAGTNGKIFRSIDNGENWTRIDSSWISGDSALERPGVNALAAHGAIMFAALGEGVFRSTDNGTHWNRVFAGVTSTAAWAVLIRGSNIFAGMYDGVFRSSDNGDTWAFVGEGLPQFATRELAANETYLFAGLNNGSVWRRPLSEISSTGAVEVSSPQYRATCYPIRPNPISASGILTYRLSDRTVVNVTVLDGLGRIVARPIVNQIQASGVHELAIDATGIDPGIYLCRIVTKDADTTFKLAVVR
jgi:photosystem II stability/assembly factor-like uncharacterized protein